MIESDPFHDLGYTAPDEALTLRDSAQSLPFAPAPESRRSFRRRNGRGPQTGEEEGVGYDGGIPYYQQPHPPLSPEQVAINQAGMDALHPEIGLILERQMLNKAGGDTVLAAAMLRAHFERTRKP